MEGQWRWIMESDETANLNQTWAMDGHGDAFVINPNWNDTLNISGANVPPGYGAVPPPVSVLTWPNTAPTYTFSDLSITQPPPAKITLNGADADIEINGESVVSMLREIRDRLAILKVSEQMEAEWDELRMLRERYEAKLAECREKSRVWAALKQTG
jgi:hypothetical protein